MHPTPKCDRGGTGTGEQHNYKVRLEKMRNGAAYVTRTRDPRITNFDLRIHIVYKTFANILLTWC